MNDLQTITPRRLRKFFAAHHYCYFSKDPDEIAKVVKVKPSTVEKWFKQEKWQEYLNFWGGVKNPPNLSSSPSGREVRSLNYAEKRWSKLFETYQPEPVTNIPIISLEVI